LLTDNKALSAEQPEQLREVLSRRHARIEAACQGVHIGGERFDDGLAKQVRFAAKVSED
jgi:hypothetical protein